MTVLAVWGAAVPGFAVLALSSVDIARVSMFLGLGALGWAAKLVYATLAALVGGLAMFAAGTVLAKFHAPRSSECFFASLGDESVRPIDPTADLGSDSLDAPLEAMPFSRPERQEEPSAVDAYLNGETTPDAIKHESSETSDQPQTSDVEADNKFEDDSLDLGAFERILDDEPESGPAVVNGPDLKARSSFAAISASQQPASGIEKLRAVPPEELSLVQLVERFAAALHDAQDAAPQDFTGSRAAHGDAERERALATALKALELFNTEGLTSSARAAMADAGLAAEKASQSANDASEDSLGDPLAQRQATPDAA